MDRIGINSWLGLVLMTCGWFSCSDPPPPPAGTQACQSLANYPYPPTSSYLGVHGGPGNNDYVPCETAQSYAEDWHQLKGYAVIQPNTFSPDGRSTYVTSSQPQPDDCNVWAFSTQDGSLEWCHNVDEGALWGAVEVDEKGDLYLSNATAIISLDAEGQERWLTPTPAGPDPSIANRPIGVHFTPDGHITTVTSQGQVLLLDRADGTPLALLDLPTAFEIPRAEATTLSLTLEELLPEAVVEDFQSLQYGSASALLSVFAGEASFSDNTIGVAPNGDLYVMGGNGEEGGLFQIKVTGPSDAPQLNPGWRMKTRKGSATSPAISPDGRHVKIADGNAVGAVLAPLEAGAMVRIADIPACDANTDADTAPGLCAPAYAFPLLTGPIMGTTPMLNEAEHYIYEFQIADLLNTDSPDLRAFRGDTLRWELKLPDQLQWTSVITVTEDHLIGTGTRFTDSGESLFSVELPATAASELIIVSRHDGEMVFRAPITDDSSSTVTVAPDGSLYVTMFSLLHVLAHDTRPVGGIIKFTPTSP